MTARQNFAKTFAAADSTKIDSIRTSKQKLPEHLPLLNLSNFNKRKSKRFHEPDFISPKNNMLNWKLLEFKLSRSIDSINNNTKKNNFEFAKQKLKRFLKKKYSELPKYDLGTFGKILGAANSIMAVILGILFLL